VAGPSGVELDRRVLTFLTRSSDDGATWTDPVAWTSPPCDLSPGVSSVSSGIAVDDEATGDVYIAFVDQRNHCGDPIIWNSDLYIWRSTDGGLSWGPSVQRSDPIADNWLAYQVNLLIANGSVYTLMERIWPPYSGWFLDIQSTGWLPPGPTPTPTATPTPTPTPTPTTAPTPTATLTPTPTATAVPVPRQRIFLPGAGGPSARKEVMQETRWRGEKLARDRRHGDGARLEHTKSASQEPERRPHAHRSRTRS
jgi:hypothetical protein